jgi:hypothetical protein
MSRTSPVAAALAVGLIAVGCAPAQPNRGLPQLVLATRFGQDNVCGQGMLPAISVKGAPAGTQHYRIRMSSLDVLSQRPWEQTIPTTGGDIEEGAAAPFPAPCLSEQQELLYRFEVMALDGGSRPLAYGQTTAFARPPARTGGPAPTGTPAPSTAPLPFDRAAGVQDGPFVLRQTPVQSTQPVNPNTRDSLNQLGGRITRPPPVQSAPIVVPPPR